MEKRSHCRRYEMPARYALMNWPKIEPDERGNITWSIGNYTPDLDRNIVIAAMDAMVQRWQIELDNIEPKGRYLRFKKTSNFRDAKIKILFMPPGVHSHTFTLPDGSEYTHHTDWPLDGEQGVLAQVPYGSHTMEMDEGEQWSIDRAFREHEGSWTLFVDIGEVAEHEFGHIMDLGHTKAKGDIMYPSYDTNIVKCITDDSRTGLAESYGKLKRMYSHNVVTPMTVPDTWEGIKYFKPHEFDSRDIGTGGYRMSLDFVARLDAARMNAGIPFVVLSGWRTREHNKAVGGKADSSHLIGRAADIRANNSHERFIILRALMDAGFTRIGVDKVFIHIDDDPSKTDELCWTYNRAARLNTNRLAVDNSDIVVTPDTIGDVIKQLEHQRQHIPAQIGGIAWDEVIDAVIEFLKGVQSKMFEPDGQMKKPGFFRRLFFGFLVEMVWAFVRKLVRGMR